MREMRFSHPDPFHLVVYAFDLLHLDGADLRPMPFRERRQKLVGLDKPFALPVRHRQFDDAQSARLELAQAVLGIAREDSCDSDELKNAALQIMKPCSSEGLLRLSLFDELVRERPASALLAEARKATASTRDTPACVSSSSMSDQYVDLARGDADVALRSGDPDDDLLVGRKIVDSVWSVYA